VNKMTTNKEIRSSSTNNLNKVGILTSGGDAPGMNACIRAVVRCAANSGIKTIGIKRGYAGVLKNDFVELHPRAVANIIQRGGTILETARCEEMKTKEGLKKAVEVLNNNHIDALITIGGDGTFRGAVALAEAGGIKIIGIPGTIDNDVYGTDYTIGFDTAVNTALDAIDKIRDTAGSLQRPFFIEVMGKSRGFIALDVGIAGGAEDILIPETVTNIEELSQEIESNFKKGKKSSIIVVAEGDDSGGVFRVAQQVWERLKLEYRICVLGHIQRGGSPTARDRILASKLGVSAVETLINGQSGYMVGEHNGRITLTPLEDTWKKIKKLDTKLLKMLKVLAT
jgi:6-phosphofructokinase 1